MASGWLIVIVVLVVAVALPLSWTVGAAQRLAAMRREVYASFMRVDAYYARRDDAVPVLLDVARTHMPPEAETLDAIAAARNSAASARQAVGADPTRLAAIAQLSEADRVLRAALARWFALAEAYPAFKHDARARACLDDLATLDQKTAYARQTYNDGALRYNAACAQRPARVLARVLGFKRASVLAASEIVEEQRKASAVVYG